MLLCTAYNCCNELVEEFEKGRSNPLNKFSDKYKILRGLAHINAGSDPLKTLCIRILLKNATTSYFQEQKGRKNNSYIWLKCMEENMS